jgi:hypothetical protein
VACRIKVLGYMEDLRSTYIFAEFLYLYQLTLHPSPNTPLISTLSMTLASPESPHLFEKLLPSAKGSLLSLQPVIQGMNDLSLKQLSISLRYSQLVRRALRVEFPS